MRVRPVFWLLLAFSCLGVLVFAATYQLHAPLNLRVARQHLVSDGIASLELHVTDSQGLPIDQARVIPSARMTNMDMLTRDISVVSRGSGTYLVQLQFTMAGPWAITISASANDFTPFEQTIQVQVT